MEVSKKVVEIVERHLDTKLNTDSYNENLVDLGLDSLKFVEIILEIEENFCIEIPDEYLLANEMDTINKIIFVVNVFVDK